MRVQRPLGMLLAGRSGMSYFVELALTLALVAYAWSGELPPLWLVASLLGWIAFDCTGGVQIIDGTIRHRQFIRVVRVPGASVSKVNVYRSVGVYGAAPVVTLVLSNGDKIKVLPMGTLSMKQARKAASDLASMIDARGPSTYPS